MEFRRHVGIAATAILAALSLSCSTRTSYMRDVSPSPAPAANQSKVVVFRPSAFAGATQFPIYEYVNGDASLMGFAESGCYFEYWCAPGNHLFLTWGEGEAFIEAELAPGKTYYVRCFAKFGLISPRPAFAPVTRDSEEMMNLSEELKGLKCREVDLCSADAYAEAKEKRVRKAKQAYDEGRKSPRLLRPDDGR